MEKLNRKIWEEYELQFPIERDIACIIGQNGTGKTHLLNHLYDYFKEKGENVVYFEEDRIFDFPLVEAEDLIEKGLRSIRKLVGLEDNSFLIKHDIIKEELFLEREYGKIINRGKIQLLNFYLNIKKQGKDVIVLIDNPEKNIHISARDNLLNDILEMSNVKKVIVATHCPSIVSTDNIVEIDNCIIR